MNQILKLRALSVLICVATVGCAAKTIRADSTNAFDGRWVATMESSEKKHNGESDFLFQCKTLPRKGGKVLHLVVTKGKGTVIGSGQKPEKGIVNTDGSFKFKKTDTSMYPTTDRKIIRIKREFTLYSVNYVGFDAGCDYQLALEKVAESFKI